MSCQGCDELAVLMQKAFLEYHSHHFIRDVRMLQEPAIIVALDRQLDDLVKFSQQLGIMTVDPTFYLGDTYLHLFLHCGRTTNHPVFIGPVVVHYRKTFFILLPPLLDYVLIYLH